jgi:murein DD-endopeptidase MepM/ murein hydrolase activator NlpD
MAQKQRNDESARMRRASGRAFTLAVIPSSGGFKREWRISYATIYFFLALLVSTGVLIAFALARKAPLDADKKISSELAAAWLARWEILEKGKERITANLDDLKTIGDEYYLAIFKTQPDLGEIAGTNTAAQQNAKILPLLSVMRILNAREEAYIGMPIGIAIHSNQITSLYGSRADPFGLEASFHAGIDFAAGTGTPIYATADGVVLDGNDAGDSSLGKNVRLLHKFGFITLYAHMNSINVKKDQKVKRGDLIGAVGTTGRSTGPHLHYEIHIKNVEPENWFELTYNPMPFIREQL